MSLCVLAISQQTRSHRVARSPHCPPVPPLSFPNKILCLTWKQKARGGASSPGLGAAAGKGSVPSYCGVYAGKGEGQREGSAHLGVFNRRYPVVSFCDNEAARKETMDITNGLIWKSHE